ncbi:pentapeptide repeat-containing protein [Nonomuraea sp. NPDC050202]|uniref:pentapeptide repeat-containing protein n=1 Tax=Nonomuraea sp. NPDC050202 TaxID=3155035 RepID=UPI0033EAB2FF
MFTGNVWFSNTTFSEDVRFDGVTFASNVGFEKATGLERAALTGARVASAAEDTWRVWPPDWQEEPGGAEWGTLRLAATSPAGGRRRGPEGANPTEEDD